MASVFAVTSKVGGFKLRPGDGFLRAIQNPQKVFLVRGSKAVGPRRKILQHVKNHFEA
jgi:hypothetical protein